MLLVCLTDYLTLNTMWTDAQTLIMIEHQNIHFKSIR